MIGRPIQKFRRYLLDRMVLRPTREAIDHPGKQRVMLHCGGQPLECFVQKNHDDDGPLDLLVLKFPGTAGRAERANFFPFEHLPVTVRGTVWTWNPPGYGKSGGRASLERMADAAIDFWDQVIERDGHESTPVLLCGNSLGCVTTLHVAATVGDHASRRGLILRNPPPLIPVVKHIADRYPMRRLVDPVAESLDDRMNAVITASQVQLPAVFLQSEFDTLVPPPLQQQVIDAYAGNKRTVLLHGLSHSGIAGESHGAAIQEAIDWLLEQIVCLI